MEDLQLAGIDVISTVNVQHLESLNDRVFELTGVRVRETIPDGVLLDADEVVLVDLTPEALQARLRAGKVYPSERVEAALLNFFTTASLDTLREVALREIAGAVDERIQRDVPGTTGRAESAPIAERVMVVARPSAGPSGSCAGPGAPPGRLDEKAVRQRDLLRGLAVTLGAHVLVLPDEELAEAISSLVRERGVTAWRCPRCAPVA